MYMYISSVFYNIHSKNFTYDIHLRVLPAVVTKGCPDATLPSIIAESNFRLFLSPLSWKSFLLGYYAFSLYLIVLSLLSTSL